MFVAGEQILEEGASASAVYSPDGDSASQSRAAADEPHLPSPSYDCVAGETDERKNAFRIINTMCSFIQNICCKSNSATPPPVFK